MRNTILAAAVALVLSVLADSGFAQTNYGGYMGPQTTAPRSQRSQSAQRSVRAPTVTATSPNNRSTSRPLSNITKKPSVSPYLNLLANPNPNVTNYQSLVRPLVNQNRINQQQHSEISNLERPSSNERGSETMRATGHQAVFGNYSHYYPGKR